ncbi:MAG: outer membrane beta-barrel protein [Verrucomicrobia bacterium]|nr:outer membrane beta-barrel protein [Verrucomicrobiota bacterium]
MKFNKWTLGLAAVGAVSMASAVRADEAKMSQVNTALANTTISGYVDVAVQYNAGNQSFYSDLPPYAYGVQGLRGPNGNGQVRDGFSLNQVDIALDKPLDDSPWAAGYHVEINAGEGAINTGSLNDDFDFSAGGLGIRQAYITMRTPVGNGIDWKLGVQDGITGYESNTGYANPNYTRSYGWIINPTTYTGLLGTYKICNEVSVTAGIADRGNSFTAIGQSNYHVSSKDYIAAVSLTAPDNWGWLKGSALNLQTIQGFDDRAVNNYSANLSLATPVAGLKVGLAYDALQSLRGPADGNIFGIYTTYQATDKLALNLRAEYVDASDLSAFTFFNKNGEEVTATVEYDLWANVVSRAEFRWDHNESGKVYNRQDSTANAFLFALNVIYKF